MADVYVVTAPYVTPKVRDVNGAWTYQGRYAGARINADDIDPDSLAHHIEGGMMAPVDSEVAADEPAVAVDPAPVDPGPGPEGDPELAGSDPARPAGNASQAAWLDYAVARRPEGMTEDEARETYGSKTRNELAAEFG